MMKLIGFSRVEGTGVLFVNPEHVGSVTSDPQNPGGSVMWVGVGIGGSKPFRMAAPVGAIVCALMQAEAKDAPIVKIEVSPTTSVEEVEHIRAGLFELIVRAEDAVNTRPSDPSYKFKVDRLLDVIDTCRKTVRRHKASS